MWGADAVLRPVERFRLEMGSGVAGADTHHLDAVRIKVTLADADLADARVEFNLAEPTARRSRLYFCEQPAAGRQLALFDAGLILRLRETDDHGREAVVLLRPCRPDRLPRRWTRPNPEESGVRIEGEWTPHERVVAASASTPVSPRTFETAIHSDRALPETFSARQRAFITECAPTQPRFGRLQPFGPVDVLSWSRHVDDLRVAATLWTVRATTLDLLELSVRAAPSEAALVQPALIALVRGRGLDPEAFAATKTRTVLALLADPGRARD